MVRNRKTNTQQEVTKVKGFTLNHNVAQKINGKVLEQLIDREVSNIKVQYNQITRDNITKNLVNNAQTKTLSFNFDKRILHDNFDTIPYGYKKYHSMWL